jgi:G3E family GTPase
MKSKIAVNLICGALGVGKTSLINQLLEHKPTHQKWALLVNEFGAVGIDGAILSANSKLMVKQLSGGCICCSAQSDFKNALESLIEHQPDRLIIEPTGLGEPDSLADLITRSDLNQHYELQQIVSVFDASNTSIDELKTLRIFQSLVHMADQAIINKIDRASEQQSQALLDYLQQCYPPIAKIHLHQHQQTLPDIRLDRVHQSPGLVFYPQTLDTARNTLAPIQFEHNWLIPVDRKIHQALNHSAIGWVFDPCHSFDWLQLQTLLNQLNHQAWSGVKRAKGVFRTGQSWMLFQWVNDQLSREIISYRKDSRFELILQDNSSFDLSHFEQQLENCLAKPNS